MKYQLHPDAAFREVAGDVFIVTADRALHQFTNATASTVFHHLQEQPATAAEIAGRLSRVFQVDEARALDDVTAFLATLVSRQVAQQIE